MSHLGDGGPIEPVPGLYKLPGAWTITLLGSGRRTGQVHFRLDDLKWKSRESGARNR